jgi:hypothetical protein
MERRHHVKGYTSFGQTSGYVLFAVVLKVSNSTEIMLRRELSKMILSVLFVRSLHQVFLFTFSSCCLLANGHQHSSLHLLKKVAK